MKIKNINKLVFHAVNKATGKEFSFKLDDLYGYEGEENGVFIKGCGTALNYNSGYGDNGMNPDIEIISVEEIE